MTSGCVVDRKSCRSGAKELEYILLGSPVLERMSYSMMILSRQETGDRFAQVGDITCNEALARSWFQKVFDAQVRPENLGEILYELLTV